MLAVRSCIVAATALLLVGGAAAAASSSSGERPALLPVRLSTRTPLNSRLANIHVELDRRALGGGGDDDNNDKIISFTYGSCSSTSQTDSQHAVGSATSASNIDRLVWLIPEDVASGGCISAWTDDGDGGHVLVGRSAPQHFDHETMHKRSVLTKRASVSKRDLDPVQMTNESGIDAQGPWFDGVALLASKNVSAVDVAAAKAKQIAIVGAGMAGLMTYLLLSQAGFRNLSLIEAGDRLGGRVHTEYLTGGPWDYSYQEMGPMRFPHQIAFGAEVYNISDHQLVFQLADEMNSINNVAGSPSTRRNLGIDFIPWIQSSPNGLVYANGFKLPSSGLPPTVAQIAADPSLGPPAVVYDAQTQAAFAAVAAGLPGEDFYKLVAENTWKAYKQWLKSGPSGLPGDQWSQYAYVKYALQASLNTTDVVAGSVTGEPFASFWSTIYDTVFFSASSWKTIDGGLSRMPQAFHPLVDAGLKLNRKIERVSFSESSPAKKVTLQWREGRGFQSSTHDYAVIAVPFSVVRGWRLPQLEYTITSAINKLQSAPICKVVLEYRTRFWEHFQNPIYGGCSTTADIPGIGQICYPSYNLNGTGPATVLASYSFGSLSQSFSAMSEQDHVRIVYEAMVEIHGDVARDQYTGKYRRKCWTLDPLEVGAFTSPTVGQMELYIPEYFKTHKHLIFVGEHTSYTHAWVASALESGIRGAVQLMLELGLIDEAKAAVEKWMARWIDV